MKNYTVNHTGFVNNIWRVKGEVIPLSDAAARYLLPNNVTLFVEPVAKPAKRGRPAREIIEDTSDEDTALVGLIDEGGNE